MRPGSPTASSGTRSEAVSPGTGVETRAETTAETSTKTAWLGTALWGWGVDAREAHAMLDAFAAGGGRHVDAAVNYPINARPADFGAANRILAAWLTANPGTLAVSCKIGALDNSGGNRENLGASAVAVATELLGAAFGEALWGVGVHWDNREDEGALAETLGALRALRKEGLELGLSGVRRPDLYAALAPDLADAWWVQVKDNAATKEAQARYAPHLPDARYLAYGINMGGVKARPSERADASLALRGLAEPETADALRALVGESFAGLTARDLNDLALMRVVADDRLAGCILGPRDAHQLKRSLEVWREANDRRDALRAYLGRIDPAAVGARE